MDDNEKRKDFLRKELISLTEGEKFLADRWELEGLSVLEILELTYKRRNDNFDISFHNWADLADLDKEDDDPDGDDKPPHEFD